MELGVVLGANDIAVETHGSLAPLKLMGAVVDDDTPVSYSLQAIVVVHVPESTYPVPAVHVTPPDPPPSDADPIMIESDAGEKEVTEVEVEPGEVPVEVWKPVVVA